MLILSCTVNGKLNFSLFILVPKKIFKLDPASIQVTKVVPNPNLKIIKLNQKTVINAINISQLTEYVTDYKVFAHKVKDSEEDCWEIDDYEYLPTVNYFFNFFRCKHSQVNIYIFFL